jgi:carbon-monoxide dehydrogenase medium subunit
MPAANLAIGSQLTLASVSGATRVLDIEAFLRTPLETSRQEGELLLSVALPQTSGRAGSAYRKWSLMTDGLPVIGVSAFLELDASDRCSSARIAITGLESGPTRVPAAERALVGVSRSNPEKIEQALNDSSTTLDTHSDEAADAEYRKVLFRYLGRDVVTRAFSRALGEMQ